MTTMISFPHNNSCVMLLHVNILLKLLTYCIAFIVASLGVEPVDRDVMKQPPRKASEKMISFSLLARVLLSAFIILSGTFWVFWREV